MTGRRSWGTLLSLAAAAGLVVLASVSFAPAAPIPAPAKGKAVPAKTDTADSAATKAESFLLPTDWRNANGSINHAAIVTQEKKRLEVINRELKVTMQMKETAHFLIFSNAPDKDTQQFVTWCEAVYANLCRQFEVGPSERVWDGKCILMLFQTRDQYKANARTFDRFTTSVDKTSGYFLHECREIPGVDPNTIPQLVHISLPVEKTIPQELQAVFAHETTHAFFELFRTPGHIPLWLHEGLAVYMEVFNEPALRGYQLRMAKEYLATNKSLAPMFADKLEDLTPAQYGVSYTLVEDLLTLGGGKFKQFIINLKDGKEVDDALKAVYGFDSVALEKQWRDGLNKVKVVKKG
jgi:hypothetical protein